MKVKYFTAIVNESTAKPGEIERQRLWLNVLKCEAPQVEFIYGRHVPRGPGPFSRREKMTDVNIAIQVAGDVKELTPAGIVIVSGDLDFLPAVTYAAEASIPVAVYSPGEQNLYRAPSEGNCGRRVQITLSHERDHAELQTDRSVLDDLPATQSTGLGQI